MFFNILINMRKDTGSNGLMIIDDTSENNGELLEYWVWGVEGIRFE